MTSPPTVITSRDNPLVKELRRLAQDGAAYRKTSRVWLEGEHLCEAAHLRGWQAEVAVISDQYPHLALMECAQSVGIDLPLKALVWEDAASQVWLGTNDPDYLARRHGVATCPAAAGMAKALAGLSEAAVAK